MILNNTPDNTVTTSNVGAISAFTIKATAKSFQILSNGLYKNKIRAIIRELSTNCVDSHVAAGKADVPFEVHLPTMLEPWFAVKDFGIGLDSNQITNIFTVYFESTKTESNMFVGALGLGAKSPFSYTENFTVTAIKNGTRRIYSAFINESGVPSIAEMGEELTDESNGVEVKFSVTNRCDYDTFRNEVSHIYSWFKVKPVITGVSNFTHREINYVEQNIIPGVHTHNNDSVAVMGNISYPINNISDEEKHFGNLSNLLHCNLIIEFDIGELDFTASREELSYIPLTIASIKNKLELLNDNLTKHLTSKVDAIENDWDKAEFLSQQCCTYLYRNAVTKYVADTKFPLFKDGYKESFTFQLPELVNRKLSMHGLRIRHGVSSRTGSSHLVIPDSTGNNIRVETITVSVEKEVIIVLNDLKIGCVERARYHYANHHNKCVTVYCVSHSDPDLAVRQVEYDKLIAELHNPPTVVKASELEKRVVEKKALSTKGIMTLNLENNGRYSRGKEYHWCEYSQILDSNETYYYVCLNNYDPIYEDGKHFDAKGIRMQMDQCGIEEISNIKIFGVRKNRIQEIKKLTNWVWIEEKLKEETAKVTDQHIASLVVAEMLDGYYNKVYTNDKVARIVGPDSDYAKYVAAYGNIKRAAGSVSHLVQLCTNYGKAVQVETVKKQIENTKIALYKKYPLLKCFKDTSDVTVVDIAEYIKMIDEKDSSIKT